MPTTHVPSHLDESAARVLAFMMAAEADGEACKTRILDELNAWNRIGVSRARFLRLVHECQSRLDSHEDMAWLPVGHRLQIDRVLDDVDDPELRLMVCRLAASVITADGRISDVERQLYDHTLARWHIDSAQVTKAILADRLH